MACTPPTGSCSTTNRRSAAKPSSPARSPAPWRPSSAASRTGSIWATSMPSAIGAMRATMSRACGVSCSRTSPTTMCWRPARRIRSGSSSSSRSSASGALSRGAAAASTSAATVGGPVKSWWRSMSAIAGRPRSICCWETRRRPPPSSAGTTAPASNSSSPRWSRRTAPFCALREHGMNPSYTLHNKVVWVAGHRGLVGSALVRRLQGEGCKIVTAPRDTVDLRQPEQVERWLREARPQAVFLAAARVGGIHANSTRPGEFIYDNLAIQTVVVEACRRANVEKLLLMGSSCIYPRLAPQPIPESALLTGPLEPTNEWYAIAKIAGIKLGQAYRRQYGCDYISVMPSNLYGPGDNFDRMQSHVVP